MATERQVEANRRNALRSTGPRTDGGKAVARGNALKHGRAAVTMVHPARAEAAEARRASWHAEIRPGTERAGWALDLAVASSFRLDDCEVAYRDLAVEQSARAGACWEEDRRLDAAVLADGLATRPEVAAPRLEATRHGCELLISRWERLGEALDVDGDWTAEERSVALDLLGIPKALRRGRTPIDCAPGGDPASHRRAAVVGQIERLGRRRGRGLDDVDDLARRQAEAAACSFLTGPGQLLRRYERDAWRRFQAAMKLAQAAADEADAPEIEPGPSRPGDVPEPEVEEDEPRERAHFPSTPEEIRDAIAAVHARFRAAVTPAERTTALLEVQAAVAMFGPMLGMPTEDESPRPNRHERRALAAQGRRG